MKIYEISKRMEKTDIEHMKKKVENVLKGRTKRQIGKSMGTEKDYCKKREELLKWVYECRRANLNK